MVMHVISIDILHTEKDTVKLRDFLVRIVEANLREDPTRLIVTFSRGDLQEYQRTLPHCVDTQGKLFTEDPRVQITPQDIAWRCRFICDSSSSYGGQHQVYAIVIKPGIGDALRNGLLARVRHEMKHHDVDETVSITYPPMSLFTGLYTTDVQDSYEAWVHDWVKEQLHDDLINFAVCENEYLCRRI